MTSPTVRFRHVLLIARAILDAADDGRLTEEWIQRYRRALDSIANSKRGRPVITVKRKPSAAPDWQGGGPLTWVTKQPKGGRPKGSDTFYEELWGRLVIGRELHQQRTGSARASNREALRSFWQKVADGRNLKPNDVKEKVAQDERRISEIPKAFRKRPIKRYL